MFPEDDFLIFKPARRENITVWRIALMALMGCLILLSALVIQARAEPDATLQRQIRAVHHITLAPVSVEPSGRIITPRIKFDQPQPR